MLRQLARGAHSGTQAVLRVVARVSGLRHNADFATEFKKVAPTLDVSDTLSSFMRKRSEVPSSIPEKLTVNFFYPHEVHYSAKEVDQVIIPAGSGHMGVLPGHLSTFAELQPGGRNPAMLMWNRGLKRKAKYSKSPYAVMWVPDDQPLQRSYPNAGSVKTTSRQMRRMELRRQFQISEKAKKTEEIKAALRARDQMRIARWRAAVKRAKDWQDFLATTNGVAAV